MSTNWYNNKKGLKLNVESNQMIVDKKIYQKLVKRLMYLAHRKTNLAHALNIFFVTLYIIWESNILYKYFKISKGCTYRGTKKVDC